MVSGVSDLTDVSNYLCGRRWIFSLLYLLNLHNLDDEGAEIDIGSEDSDIDEESEDEAPDEDDDDDDGKKEKFEHLHSCQDYIFLTSIVKRIPQKDDGGDDDDDSDNDGDSDDDGKKENM